MSLLHALIAVVALQTSQTAPPTWASESAPTPAVQAAAPSQTLPAVDPQLRQQQELALQQQKVLDKQQELVRQNFTGLHWERLSPSDWQYVGVYYGSNYGIKVLFVLVLMTLAWTLAGWASSITRKTLERVRFDETLTIFSAKLVRWGILTLVGVLCLSKFGIETASLAAVVGAAGLAIGLAFQGTLSNFAAGAMLLIFRPYKVGDSVVVAGNSGTVAEIELFTTALDTADNRRVIIPNSSIYGTVIENHTANPLRRAEVLVGTAYSADIDDTRAALNRAVLAVPLITTEKKTEVVLLELGGSSVNWAVRGWAKREVLGDAKQALIRAVKYELDHAGIDIPFPQLAIHLDQPAQAAVRRVA